MYGNREPNHQVIGMHHYLIGHENERNQLENINKNKLNRLFCIILKYMNVFELKIPIPSYMLFISCFIDNDACHLLEKALESINSFFVTLRRPLGIHIFIGLSNIENQRRGKK
jgi:hypothetical protein